MKKNKSDERGRSLKQSDCGGVAVRLGPRDQTSSFCGFRVFQKSGWGMGLIILESQSIVVLRISVSFLQALRWER